MSKLAPMLTPGLRSLWRIRRSLITVAVFILLRPGTLKFSPPNSDILLEDMVVSLNYLLMHGNSYSFALFLRFLFEADARSEIKGASEIKVVRNDKKLLKENVISNGNQTHAKFLREHAEQDPGFKEALLEYAIQATKRKKISKKKGKG